MDAVPETGGAADLTQLAQGFISDVDVLDFGANVDDGDDLLQILGHRPDDQRPVEKVHGHAVRALDVGPSDAAHAPVGGHDQDGRESGLQGIVQLGECLDVQHVYLIDKQYSRH